MHTTRYRSRKRSTSVESIHEEGSRSRSRSPITSRKRDKELKSGSDLQTKDEQIATTSETSSDASSEDESSSTKSLNDTASQRIKKGELQHINYAEVFYPREHVQTPNDSSCKMNGWENVSPELHVPPLFKGMDGRTTIPIYKLSHITREDFEDDIKQQDHYIFKPNKKTGKDYYSDRNGTYVLDRNYLVKIQSNKTVLTGRFSWWEIDTTQWYKHAGTDFGKAVRQLQSERVFLAPYLSNPRESMYGDLGFVVDFKHLLECYKKSRTDIADTDNCAVNLRLCGTLAYRHEVCYVVIVCTEHDSNLQHYPSLHDSPVFNDDNLVGQDGEIDLQNLCTSEPPKMLHFQSQYVIKCAPIKQYSCYETPAFAFYYPDDGEEYRLKCEEKLVTLIQAKYRQQ